MKLLLFTVLVLLECALMYVLVDGYIAHAQEVGQAYTLDHPINPDWLILATPTGRYSVTRIAGDCDWLRGDMEVRIDQVQDVIAHVSSLTSPNDGCVIGFVGLADATPCFADADGQCSLTSEHWWGN